jgi:hypothetical protein
MAKDWKKELKEIITSQQNKIKQVVDDREKRETDRLKMINEIKDIIRPRFEFIIDLVEKDKYLISQMEPTQGSGPEPPSPESTKEAQAENLGNVPSIPLNGETGEKSEFIDELLRGSYVAKPVIKEGPAELALVMPALSEVNRLDILYQIAFQDEKPILHTFDLYSPGKMKNNGSAHGNFEEFVQDSLKRFLLSWFTRKEGTELDKEREFKLIIQGHGLKD